MKTYDEMLRAREQLSMRMALVGLSSDQLTLLRGMSTALQWASGDGGTALQRLVDGEEFALGRTAAEAETMIKESQKTR